MTVWASVSPRERIVVATYGLLTEGGRDAVSTRAITAAADVQAPTIYRQFGDLSGLLSEVANYGFRSYLQLKHATPVSADPVADLGHGWDSHVRFGLAEPAVYALMYGDPRPGPRPSAVHEARALLRSIVERIADAGRLNGTVERAADMVDVAGVGVVLRLLESAPPERDLSLSVAMRDAVLAAITTPPECAGSVRSPSPKSLPNRASSLKAALSTESVRLSPSELSLMNDWLDRLSTPVQSPER